MKAIIAPDISGGYPTSLQASISALESVERGGTGDSSKDGWIAFWAGKHVYALDTASNQIFSANMEEAPGEEIPKIDFVLISKGIDAHYGKRYVLVCGWPSLICYSVNETSGELDFEYRGPQNPESPRSFYGSHIDTIEGPNGEQCVIYVDDTRSPNEYALNLVRIAEGKNWYRQLELGGPRTKVMVMQLGGGDSRSWVDNHISAAKNAPIFVVSECSIPRPSTDTKPWEDFPHNSEIIAGRINENGTIDIRRAVRSKSVRFTDSSDEAYWPSPRASVSNNGIIFVYTSNFGEIGKPRICIADTGF